MMSRSTSGAGYRRSVAAAVSALVAVTVLGSVVAADPLRTVIVSASSDAAAASAVRASGGSVILDLPIVSGVAARVPASRVAALAAVPGVLSVTPNRRVRVADAGGDTTGASETHSVFAHETRADDLWRAGITGAGVRVALIDTGVSAVPDLADRLVKVPDPTGSGKLVDCVDFSGESSCNDSYGHGTFIAGLIAGTGASSNGVYTGVAPGAQIVSVKIAGRDGSADVTKVLAAIEWVVSFAKDLNIKVLNLSLGTDSTVSYRFDPLNFAVERAWRAGLTVVVAAGNRGVMTSNGPQAGTISKPADDPLVVTVGAVDDRQTGATSDDRMPFFSAHGPTAIDGLAKPDLIAPGAHVISLRSPGSTVEKMAPGGGINGTYRRGSGTSMATGIVSGLAALITQAQPGWTPDRIKFALVATAHKVAVRDVMWTGAGLVDAASAASLPGNDLANQGVQTLSDATGTLDGSRANVLVTATCASSTRALVDPNCGKVLRDNTTAQGLSFNADQYTQSQWTSTSWYSSQWNSLLGSAWYGSSWYGSSWYGSSWYGSSWYGSWDNTSYGISIPGSSWYGAWD